MIRFTKRGRTMTTDAPKAPQLAPETMPRDQRPAPMLFRFWRWEGLLVAAGTLEAPALMRLDYMTGHTPYVAGQTPPPMTTVGAHVAIAGPAAATGGTLAKLWVHALSGPVAIELWQTTPLQGQGALHRGTPSYRYAVLPHLRADRAAQHHSPTFTDAHHHGHPAYRFRAEPGHAWGTGPAPIRYNLDTRSPDVLEAPVPTNRMWAATITTMSPKTALAQSWAGPLPQQVNHDHQ
jgi:hypothetical protein